LGELGEGRAKPGHDVLGLVCHDVVMAKDSQ
jgi:hypothetical protein